MPEKRNVRALSSVYGKIEEVVLALPGSSIEFKVDLDQTAREFSGIWDALDNRVRFHLYGNHKGLGIHRVAREGKEPGKERMLPILSGDSRVP